jgi:predicted aminopeptidase
MEFRRQNDRIGSPAKGRAIRMRVIRPPHLSLVLLVVALGACSPGYVLKGAWNGWQILRTREPATEMALSPDTDERTRGRLMLVREALGFAEDSLGFEVGGTYSTVVHIPSDTLSHIVSAAYPDRLASYTWWFPIVGRVPYKGYFDLVDAQKEESKLAGEGYDTWLRPTSAFSTLGWLEDPIPTTILRYDEVALVETVLHELAHGYLFVSGEVQFNESFATWVGNAGAAAFFCTRRGGGPDTVWCHRARARWEDDIRFSGFLDPLVEELQTLYGDPNLTREDKILVRQAVFEAALSRFDQELSPTLEASTFSSFRDTPLNNATLLGRMRYYHRLADFQGFQVRHDGDLRKALQALKAELAALPGGEGADPFDTLLR